MNNSMKGQHYIAGHWVQGAGPTFFSYDPATGEEIWRGAEALVEEVNTAVMAARTAFSTWSQLAVEQRLDYLVQFQKQLITHSEAVALAIALDVAKPLWEARTEVQAMIKKIDISINAYHERSGVRTQVLGKMTSVTRHKPHGVVAVLGPFNFPGHLPNGHIIPALLAGNTVVFKPSEKSPLVAEKIMQLWHATNIPPGVINMVQGGIDCGKSLMRAAIDGLFFTGSYEVGLQLCQQFAASPEKILALEMGGNNPLIVWQVKDNAAAVHMTIQSAFITAGQRCTCARRLFISADKKGDEFLALLINATKNIIVDRFNAEPEPFMGAVISPKIAQKLLATQQHLIQQGGKSLLPMISLRNNTGLVSPGIIETTSLASHADTEIFGPLLQVIRCDDFTSAITQANQTQFGLAAGLLSDDADLYAQFYQGIQAGVLAWNRPLTGAASEAPFGGIGKSGNHRPSAYYAADYCAYPVASLEAESLTMLDIPQLPGLSL